MLPLASPPSELGLAPLRSGYGQVTDGALRAVFGRKTGDLDLSVALVSDVNEYLLIKDTLLKYQYTNDQEHKYRFYPPVKLPGAIAYIDLLAHPSSNTISKSEAIQIIGAGSEFSFAGFKFAEKKAFQLTPRVLFPNPFGIWALKQVSYLDDPIRRVKDLADSIELASGLVEKGTHFDLQDLWNQIKSEPETIKVKQMLSDLAKGDSSEWDLENARQQLLLRNFSSYEIENTLPQRLSDLVEILS